MYELRSNQERCKQCWTCESLLPGFITKDIGLKSIDSGCRNFEDMQAAATSIVAACPNGAITFYKISGYRG